MKIDRKYLPSEQFIARVIIIVIIIIVILSIYGLVKFIKRKINEPNTPKSILITELVQKDSNSNGIADWEETLWGLNPEKDGEENKAIITGKKEFLSAKDNVDTKENIKDNELLSRQFFAIIIALQQNESLNQESINEISKSIGEKIDDENIPNAYDETSLRIVENSPVNIDKYYNSFKILADKYKEKDIGNELSFIAQGLKDTDPQALYAAKDVANSYKSFSEELIKIPVPENISRIHLSLANNYDKTSISIYGLTQIIDDPLTGMKSILNYKKYNDALVEDLNKLSGFLN